MKIERTERFVTTVDELVDAWKFVMDHIDLVGPDPTVHINPVWTRGNFIQPVSDDESWARRFEVMVEGMQEVES